MGEATIRVVLVDDHPMLREGTAALLDACADLLVVGQTGRGLEAIELVERLRPEVLVLDLHLPDLSGVEVARRVRASRPTTAILVLSNYEDAGYVRALLQIGARGYLGKSAPGKEIVAAVRAIARGDATVLSESARLALGSATVSLSTREREVLALIAAGARNAVIAATLSIAESTVEYHVRHILTKLDARSRTEAVNRPFHNPARCRKSVAGTPFLFRLTGL